MRRGEGYTDFCWGNQRERGNLRKPVADGRIIFRWIFRKWEMVLWTELIWLRIWTGVGHL